MIRTLSPVCDRVSFTKWTSALISHSTKAMIILLLTSSDFYMYIHLWLFMSDDGNNAIFLMQCRKKYFWPFICFFCFLISKIPNSRRLLTWGYVFSGMLNRRRLYLELAGSKWRPIPGHFPSLHDNHPFTLCHKHWWSPHQNPNARQAFAVCLH